MRTRKQPREDALAYLSMAEELMGVSARAAADGLTRAPGIIAIHAAISAADGVCTRVLGERYAGQDHGEAAELLETTRVPGVVDKVKQLRAIVAVKSRFEYEARPPSAAESEELVKRAERFVKWAGTVIRGPSRR